MNRSGIVMMHGGVGRRLLMLRVVMCAYIGVTCSNSSSSRDSSSSRRRASGEPSRDASSDGTDIAADDESDFN